LFFFPCGKGLIEVDKNVIDALMKNSTATPYFALTAAMVFWGLSFVATKIALESLPTFTLVFARFALGSCLFLVLMARYGLPHFTLRVHGKLLLTAIFEPGLYFVFETIGLQQTTAPKAALIIALTPVVVLVLAFLFLGERSSPLSLFGVVMSLAGIVVLVGGDPKFRWALVGHLRGDLLIFGAVVSAALYIVCARDLGRTHSAREITTMQTIYGALFYLLPFLLELPEITWSNVSGRSLVALAYLTVFATFAGFLCYNFGLTKVSASRSSVFINGIPVVTAIAAWLLLGEKLTALQATGGFLVLLGVYLANLPGSQTEPQQLGATLS
jgi:drug/metabolite transporter (DMT)-like permease